VYGDLWEPGGFLFPHDGSKSVLLIFPFFFLFRRLLQPRTYALLCVEKNLGFCFAPPYNLSNPHTPPPDTFAGCPLLNSFQGCSWIKGGYPDDHGTSRSDNPPLSQSANSPWVGPHDSFPVVGYEAFPPSLPIRTGLLVSLLFSVCKAFQKLIHSLVHAEAPFFPTPRRKAPPRASLPSFPNSGMVLWSSASTFYLGLSSLVAGFLPTIVLPT